MRKAWTSWTLVSLLALVLVACSWTDHEVTAAGPTLSPKDVEAIQNLSQSHSAAMNRGDWEAVASFYAEDAVRIPPNGQPHRGRSGLVEHLRGFEVEEWSYDSVRLTGSGDIAYELGEFTFQFRMPGNPESLVVSGDCISVLRRQQNGIWKIVAESWSELPAGASPGLSKILGPSD